jgi:hypothetical protein
MPSKHYEQVARELVRAVRGRRSQSDLNAAGYRSNMVQRCEAGEFIATLTDPSKLSLLREGLGAAEPNAGNRVRRALVAHRLARAQARGVSALGDGGRRRIHDPSFEGPAPSGAKFRQVSFIFGEKHRIARPLVTDSCVRHRSEQIQVGCRQDEESAEGVECEPKLTERNSL